MKRVLKGKKALSPVVAAIILIAVTVAVSIAVAAWLGAITFTFMKTEELKITHMAFVSPANITLTLHNIGSNKVTVGQVKVNDGDVSSTSPTLPLDIAAGSSTILEITLTSEWTDGNKYRVALVSATGTDVAAYEATA